LSEEGVSSEKEKGRSYRKKKALGSREIPRVEGPGSGLIPNATENDKFEMSPRGVKADFVAVMFLL
jgi:hypothetical protein